MNLIKAEILFTRKCNKKCNFCGMIRNNVSTLSLDLWDKGLDQLKKLNCNFLAIYGAEPLYEFDRLLQFLELVNNKNIAYTIITNLTLLNKLKLNKLKKVGLNSITFSIDTLNSNNKNSRDNYAIKWIDILIDNFKDVEGSMTITSKNKYEVENIIKFLTSKNVWFSFDFYHYDKGHYNTKVTKLNKNFVLTTIDIMSIIDIIIDLKIKGYKIHQTIEALIVMKKHLIYDWKCSYPYFVSINADGSMLVCDDCGGENVEKIKVYELYDKWNEFVTAWKKDNLKCNGCMWSTHIMSELMHNSEYGNNYFRHLL
jgi:MoaA/NifB/PqqE/SkfB family radical SAM enzyme